MAIKVRLTRKAGKLLMTVDAKGLHDTLDAIGCQHDGMRYLERPSTTFAVANNSFRLSTSALLHRVYPMEFDLSAVYSTPPAYANLLALANSADDAARKILEHYQPIDISVEINKKVINNA